MPPRSGPGPVGAHLSGGLDSSGVAALAARELRRQGRAAPLAFTWLPDLGGGAPEPEHAPEYALVDCWTAGCWSSSWGCHTSSSGTAG